MRLSPHRHANLLVKPILNYSRNIMYVECITGNIAYLSVIKRVWHDHE